MQSLFDIYETSEKKEQEGVEVQFPPNGDGTIPTFIVAHSGKSNKPYSLALEKATKPFQRIGIDAMGNQAAETALLNIFVDHVLKGWRNVKRRDGTEVEFNRENAIDVMKKLPRLYASLQDSANSLALFKDEVKDEQAGN